MCRTLADWLESNLVSDAAFARAIGVRSRMTVTRYRRGEQVPRPEIMARIVEATGGAVLPNHFYASHPSTLTDQVDAASRDGTGTPAGTPAGKEDAA